MQSSLVYNLHKHKNKIIWLIAFLTVITILVAAISTIKAFNNSAVTVHLGDGVFKTQLAQTEDERRRGLANQVIGPQQAMLFVFDSSKKHAIWMKDMRISIDAVWLNDKKQVVDLARNISPNSYPKTFAPKTEARYIIEFLAGTIKSRNIKQGQQASFDLPEQKI